jgi:hypothetical protein
MHSFPHLFTPARGRVAALLSSLLLIAACGGGGGDGSTTTGSSTDTGTATATASTQGTVTGFGSVIVNGVRFDDTGVSATDDDGQKVALALGMRCEIDSGSIDTTTGTARAVAMRTGGLVTGPVQGTPVAGVDAGTGTLIVLGQGVDVTATTVFDDSLAAGLSAVADGAVVEVHGLRDSATGRIVATRIEAKTAATVYKLRGSVSALDTTAKTFSIGGAAISYAAVTTVPATLAEGVVIRVLLATAPVAGVWQAQSLGGKAATTTTAAQAHVRGVITAFTSATAFSIDGIPVDASAATFPDGSTGLALGVQVEVKGTLTNGTIVATEVELESRHKGDDDRKFRLHGAVTSVDATAKTFLLRGITVSYAGTVTYTGGTEAGLVAGAKVEVRGTVGATRNTLAATAIKFES